MLQENALHEFSIIEFLIAPALAEIIIIDNETINSKNILPTLSIPKTVITNGAQARGGTGLYSSTNGSKKPLANLFKPINIPSGTPRIIPKTRPRNTLKKRSHM